MTEQQTSSKIRLASMREALPHTLYSAHKGASEEGRVSSIQNFGQQNPQLAINKAILSHFVEDARQSGAFNFISQTKRTIIVEYLTTQQSLAELGTKAIAGRRRRHRAVRMHVLTGMQTTFQHLPPELQETYGSPENIHKLRSFISHTRTGEQRERLSLKMQGIHKGQKRQLSELGIANIRKAQQLRRDREREEKLRRLAPLDND